MVAFKLETQYNATLILAINHLLSCINWLNTENYQSRPTVPVEDAVELDVPRFDFKEYTCRISRQGSIKKSV